MSKMDQLIQIIEREFDSTLSGKILDLLIPFGTAETNEQYRISNAILKLSKGNTEEIIKYVNTAKNDWRDVLAWAEYPMQSRDPSFVLSKHEKDIRKIYVDLDRFQYENWLSRIISTKDVLNILNIGIDTTIRGKGISLKKALNETNYSEIRKKITTKDIKELIINEPQYIEKWIMYSEDKRTSGGYALISCKLPKIENDLKDQLQCIKMIDTVGEYVLSELDFWNGISG